ncbi:hypothetical protein C1H46_025189 [Malus baccata]|uniref:Uncharacterized protein n=1 Tax=Malus baccata TaxID=106549 RepID=A0A540LSF9_MALBA|nr:hypothetical protein C1H46_025189 [Malus baccata]
MASVTIPPVLTSPIGDAISLWMHVYSQRPYSSGCTNPNLRCHHHPPGTDRRRHHGPQSNHRSHLLKSHISNPPLQEPHLNLRVVRLRAADQGPIHDQQPTLYLSLSPLPTAYFIASTSKLQFYDGHERLIQSTLGGLSEGPYCIYVGPIKTANKETLEALYRQASDAYYSAMTKTSIGSSTTVDLSVECAGMMERLMLA